MAISNHTRKDFLKYLNIPQNKVIVCPLGVGKIIPEKTAVRQPDFIEFKQSSWGDIPTKLNIEGKKFLLFVGGADPRRQLIELVAAFNNMRARGQDIELVLAGDTMQGPKTIPVLKLQKYLLHDTYLEHVHFLGFASDSLREWLYRNAHALVYPSLYEGFGLPVLEAMRYGTPVITYANSSIVEVAGDAALYAKDYKDIIDLSITLDNKDLRKSLMQKGQKQAEKFQWDKSIRLMLSHITS